MFRRFSSFYFLIKYKYINTDKFINYCEEKGVTKYVDIKSIKEKAGDQYADLAVAYVINYIFDIIRIPGCLFILSYWFRKAKKVQKEADKLKKL